MIAGWLRRFDELDRRLIAWMAAHGTGLLRIALGVVYLWFGGLKLAGRSPVAELVAQSVPWVPPDILLPALGLWEVAVGSGLVLGIAIRLVLLLFWLQLLGTLSVPILLPEISFQQGNPLLLTTTGEFVVKNLVLISAGLVVGSTVRPRGRRAVPGGRGSGA